MRLRRDPRKRAERELAKLLKKLTTSEDEWGIINWSVEYTVGTFDRSDLRTNIYITAVPIVKR